MARTKTVDSSRYDEDGNCIVCKRDIKACTDPISCEAIAWLRRIVPKGSTIHCVKKQITRGNASTVIDFFLFDFDPCMQCNGRGGTIARRHGECQYTGEACPTCHGRRGTVRPIWLSRMIANAGLGRWDERHEGIRQGGHGLDRASFVVRKLAHALYDDENALTREWL